MKRFFLLSLMVLVVMPLGAHAATTSFEYSGWIPYWRSATGTADVMPNIKLLSEVNPFGYTMKSDGTINDAAKINQEPWLSLRAAAKSAKVRFIPSIMWGNGDAIHATLSNAAKRRALEDSIADLIKTNNFDGIEIDFEAKKAETKDYFSLFLKGLYQRVGNKWVVCDIEARTPLEDRYDGTPPTDATKYANDYVAINKYCDRVKIMAYDQGSIDLALNKARAAPYVPVADPTWVERVMTLAAKTISKKKLMIGVPTYGYEYSVSPLSEYGYRYDMQWALNPKYATDLANQLGVTPVRNSSGELSFIYKVTTQSLADSQNDSNATETASAINSQVPSTLYSQAALASSVQPPFNIVWWSDAQAIADKVAIAKKLGLRGVAIFKLDGGEDQNIWTLLKTGNVANR